MPDSFPALRRSCSTTADARTLAEFYRALLGYVYRAATRCRRPGNPTRTATTGSCWSTGPARPGSRCSTSTSCRARPGQRPTYRAAPPRPHGRRHRTARRERIGRSPSVPTSCSTGPPTRTSRCTSSPTRPATRSASSSRRTTRADLVSVRILVAMQPATTTSFRDRSREPPRPPTSAARSAPMAGAARAACRARRPAARRVTLAAPRPDDGLPPPAARRLVVDLVVFIVTVAADDCGGFTDQERRNHHVRRPDPGRRRPYRGRHAAATSFSQPALRPGRARLAAWPLGSTGASPRCATSAASTPQQDRRHQLDVGLHRRPRRDLPPVAPGSLSCVHTLGFRRSPSPSCSALVTAGTAPRSEPRPRHLRAEPQSFSSSTTLAFFCALTIDLAVDSGSDATPVDGIITNWRRLGLRSPHGVRTRGRRYLRCTFQSPSNPSSCVAVVEGLRLRVQPSVLVWLSASAARRSAESHRLRHRRHARTPSVPAGQRAVPGLRPDLGFLSVLCHRTSPRGLVR